MVSDGPAIGGLGVSHERVKWKHLALWAALIGGAYLFCLRFVFGGQFHPLTPYHDDFYMMFAECDVYLGDLLRLPRVAAFTLVGLFQPLGFEGAAAAVVLASMATLLALVLVAREVGGRLPPWPLVLLYATAVFSSPRFFEAHVFDLFHTIAGFFFALALLAWFRSRETPNARHHAMVLALLSLSLLSKETYLPAVLLFFGVQVLRPDLRRGTRPFVSAGLAVGAITLAALQNHFATFSWVGLGAPSAHPYALGLDALRPALGLYLRGFGGKHALAFLAVALLLQRSWRHAFLFVAMGLSTYVPMAMLKNHVDPMYGWMGVPLGYVPILLIEGERLAQPLPWLNRYLRLPVVVPFAFAVVVLFGAAAVEARRVTRDSPAIAMQSYHRNVLAGVETLKRRGDGAARVLVAGLHDTHPFTRRAARYLGGELLAHTALDLTVVIPDGEDSGPGAWGCVAPSYLDRLRWRTWRDATQDVERYEAFVVFGPDGTLAETVTAPVLRQRTEAAGTAWPPPAVELEALLFDDARARRYAGARALWQLAGAAVPPAALSLPPGARSTSAADGLHLTFSHDDPVIFLPTLAFARDRPTLLRVDLSLPQSGTLQIFYETASEPGYAEARSVRLALPAGRHARIIELPADVSGRLRLDPGPRAGEYVLHDIELRQPSAVDP